MVYSNKTIKYFLSGKVIIISAIIFSFLVIVPVYFSCQSDPIDREINQKDKRKIINWLTSKLTDFYVEAQTANKMSLFIKNQFEKGNYNEDSSLLKFLDHLTKDLQSKSQDKHIRLKLNLDMPDPQTDGTEEAIPDAIIGEKRNNFQFKELKVLSGNIGYLRFDAFRDPKYASSTAIAALNFLANCDAVIIDLRYNGGGYAELVQLILSYFFSEPVHYLNTLSRKDNKLKEWKTYKEVTGSRIQNALVYVLTSNEYTFSAAEEFAFVMQNQNRGIVIGETTTGGAHGIDFYYLREYAIEFRIPAEITSDPVTKENWERSGIEPDIKCASKDAFEIAYIRALKDLLENVSGFYQEKLEWLLTYRLALYQPFNLDSSALALYTGNFGPVTINLDCNKLFMKMATEENPKFIYAISETRFIVEGDEETRLQFDFDNQGKVVSLTGIRIDGKKKKFERVEKPPFQLDRLSRKQNFKTSANSDSNLFNQLGIEFVFVEGAEFEMGDIFSEGTRVEIPVHKVKVNSFYLSKTEVTFSQYDYFCQQTGREKPDDLGWGRGERPVINISWFDAVKFCHWLSQKSGFFIDLPTEAEWEFAARERGKKIRFGNGKNVADPQTINFNGSEDEKKTYSVNGLYREKPVPVAEFAPNELGLFDMSGNVWEYCADWYSQEYYRNSPYDNPAGPVSGRYRIIRGGSYAMGPGWLRNTMRAAWSPDSPNNQNGFRLVLLK